MQTLKARLTGIAPLMMHNERLVNPRNKIAQALKLLTAQRKKTPEIQDQISRIEWEGGLYEIDGMPVLPADNVLACVKEGARKRKLGGLAEAAIFTTKKHFPLVFDAPDGFAELRDPEVRIQALWDDGRFFDYRGVGVQQAKVMRSRPIFIEWSVEIELLISEDVLSVADVATALSTAGACVGLCEKRPQNGRFSVEVLP